MTLCKDQTEQLIAKLLEERPASEHAAILAGAEKLVMEATSEDVRTIQTNRLISLGFHKVLGMTEDEFINAVPLPKEGKTGHILVISQRYVSPHTATQLIGVNGKRGKNYLDLDYLIDTDEACIPKGMFYWRYDLRVQFNVAPINYFKWCLKNKRLPGVANESIYVAAQKSEDYKGRALDCPGSRYDSDYVPYLDLCGGGPELCGDYAGRASPRYGSFSFGE